MALTNNYTFSLDMIPGGPPPIINASQSDVGRQFVANLYWNGEVWTPGSGVSATLRGKKPDKTVFDYDSASDAAVTISGSTVTFETTEQMTIISGPVKCELVFTNGTKTIATANFLLCVEGAAFDPDALSESDITGLSELISEQVSATIESDIADALDANIIDTAHVAENAITSAKLADGAVTSAKIGSNAVAWGNLASAVHARINSNTTEIDALDDALTSGAEEDAGYHLGFYLDENGDLCQVEEM